TVTWNHPQPSTIVGSYVPANTSNGTPVIIATAGITNPSTHQILGYVSVAISSQSLQAEQTTGILISIFALVLFILFGLFAMFLLKKTVVKPVETLKQ
ncbi:MAG TPA: hypothetical protein PL001_00375, partial [Candidatus Kryptobacter bacterium]|nr:hypothetical protein [Candidatus Kryptobacter bacterium]